MAVESSFSRQWNLIKEYGQNIIWCHRGKGPLDLAREIKKGESHISHLNLFDARMLKLQEGLLREATISCIFIYYDHPDGKQLQLVEAFQVFNSGEVVERGFEWATEKQYHPPDIDPEDTAIRALKEEIGIEVQKKDKRINFLRQVKKSNSADTYPNLQSIFEVFDYEVTLTDKEFNNKITLPDGSVVNGFMEIQEAKVTYFVWKVIN